MTDMLPYVTVALSIATAIATVVLWLRRPGEDATQQVVQLRAETRESLASQAGRMNVLEERVKHMPTSDEHRELVAQMHAMRERLAGLDDTAKTTRATVQRIEDFLRENR